MTLWQLLLPKVGRNTEVGCRRVTALGESPPGRIVNRGQNHGRLEPHLVPRKWPPFLPLIFCLLDFAESCITIYIHLEKIPDPTMLGESSVLLLLEFTLTTIRKDDY
jgi:hypothetical protein